jgi:hypothetical protein
LYMQPVLEEYLFNGQIKLQIIQFAP